MQKILLVFMLLLIDSIVQAQYSEASSYSTVQGLPSNTVYKCLQDHNGFLWVCTTTGIAKFDGTHFKVYTTQDGLPDNEVLEIVKEKNGTLWVNCFNKGPAYFNEKQDRFINDKEDTILSKMKSGVVTFLFSLQDGGVQYNTYNGSYIFKENKCYAVEPNKQYAATVVGKFSDKNFITVGAILNQDPNLSLYKIVENKLQHNKQIIAVNAITSFQKYCLYKNGVLIFLGNSTTAYYISNIDDQTLNCKIDSFKLKKPSILILNKYFFVIE